MAIRNLIQTGLVLAVFVSLFALSPSLSQAQPFDLPKPVLECPPDGNQFGGQTRCAVLSWQPVPGFNFNPPDNHRYQVLFTGLPQVPVTYPRFIVDSSAPAFRYCFTLPGPYTWAVRVVSYDTISDATTAVVSPMSNPFVFNYVVSGPPPLECGPQVPFTIPPVPIAPEDGSHYVSSQVSGVSFFKWLNVPNFDKGLHRYEVRLNYISGGTPLMASLEPTSATVQGFARPQSDFKTTYNWTVRVVSALNPTRVASGDSVSRSFTIYHSYPAPKATIDIDDDGTQSKLDLFAFSNAWDTQANEPNYNEAADFLDDDIIDWNDLLLFNYRVGLLSDPNYNTPLAQPILSGPPHNSTFPIADALNGKISLAWGAVPGAQVYLVTITGPRSFVLPVSAPQTSQVFPTAVTSTGNYSWSVTATAPGIGDPWNQVGGPARMSSPPSAERMLSLSGGQ